MNWFMEAQWLHWLMVWTGSCGIIVLTIWIASSGRMPKQTEKREAWDRAAERKPAGRP